MVTPSPPVLVHFCCSHMAPGIERDQVLWPRPQILIPVPVVWLTDLVEPDRDALGLSSKILSCDRLEFRVTVDPADAVWWPRYGRTLPRDVREEYETAADGLRPVHWWVSEKPVPVVRVAARP